MKAFFLDLVMANSPQQDARQLRKLNFDLANYFSNTIIPQLFVDADLILRIFTPPAMEQFSLTYDHVGMNIADIKDNLRYPYIVEDIQDVIHNVQSSFEKEVQTTDGSWFQMNIVPYVEHEEERINGVIITFVDITRRLLAIRELESLNAKHDTLMYALAHDIRQPISAITLMADALVRTHQMNDSEQFEKIAKNLKQSAQSLKSIVDDFTSANEQDETAPNEGQILDIEEICNHVLTALKPEIRTGKIEVITDFQVRKISLPKSNLRSVVYNLVHNAIKFRNTKKASKLEISTTKEDNFVVLCIKDNGLGIAPEHHRGVFDKTSRLNEEIPGTGMGLYVVKRMIEENEGWIKLESKEGIGTTFKVFFKVGGAV